MAGINFKDIALLTYRDIDNGRIYYARRKTGKMMNCCLTEQAQEIIDKYRTDQVAEDYIFPILDRHRHTTERQILDRVKKALRHVNRRLHELSEEIGLHTPLTTYVARHTYATVLKRSGVSVALISESLGHSDLSTTQIYLDSFENSQIDAAMQHLLWMKIGVTDCSVAPLILLFKRIFKISRFNFNKRLPINFYWSGFNRWL